MEKQIKEENKAGLNLNSGNRGKTSWTRTLVFLIGFFLIATYMSQAFDLYLDPDENFNEVDSVVPEMKKKTVGVKDFDLSVFESDKYRELKEDKWHQFDESELRVGNKNPFSAKN